MFMWQKSAIKNNHFIILLYKLIKNPLKKCTLGMVAMCAGCNVYEPWAALVIGTGAGVSFITLHFIMLKLQVYFILLKLQVHFFLLKLQVHFIMLKLQVHFIMLKLQVHFILLKLQVHFGIHYV